MIWFILGVSPFVVALILALIKVPEAVLFIAAVIATVLAAVLLAIYGGWQMHWFNHCGTFWQSYDCTGKVITP